MKNLLTLIALCALFGCDVDNRPLAVQKATPTSSIVIYDFEDRGCLFLAIYHGGIIHHPMCENPKHGSK